MEHTARGVGAVAGAVPGLVVVGVLLAYAVAAALERRGRGWSLWRAGSFALGAVLLATAVLPPLAPWAHRDLRGHMVQHLLLGMMAPLALVLGAPVTLLLRRVPVAVGRRISAVLKSRFVQRLTHPATALAVDTGGLYLLYLTPLYGAIHGRPLLNAALHLHFLAAGYLFAASIAGPDPAPHRPRFRVRLAVLFVAMAAHATLAKTMYAYGWPRGAGHDAAQIRDAAQIMYYGGDAAELLLAVALFASWRGWKRRRPAKRRTRFGPGLRTAS